jgi:hypothetical protein
MTECHDTSHQVGEHGIFITILPRTDQKVIDIHDIVVRYIRAQGNLFILSPASHIIRNNGMISNVGIKRMLTINSQSHDSPQRPTMTGQVTSELILRREGTKDNRFHVNTKPFVNKF